MFFVWSYHIKGGWTKVELQLFKQQIRISTGSKFSFENYTSFIISCTPSVVALEQKALSCRDTVRNNAKKAAY